MAQFSHSHSRGQRFDDASSGVVSTLHVHYIKDAGTGATTSGVTRGTADDDSTVQPRLISRKLLLDQSTPLSGAELSSMCRSLFDQRLQPLGMLCRGSFVPLSAVAASPSRWHNEHLFILSASHDADTVSKLLSLSQQVVRDDGPHASSSAPAAATVAAPHDPDAIDVDARTRSKMRSSMYVESIGYDMVQLSASLYPIAHTALPLM